MTQTKSRVVAYGELLFDAFPSGEVLGGAPANFSAHLNSLGIPSAIATCVGNDDRGKNAVALLKERGLDTSLIQTSENAPTGVVTVELNDQCDPRFTIQTEVAFDEIALEDELCQRVSEAELLYFGTLIQRSPRSKETLYSLIERCCAGQDGEGVKKFLDINLRENCYTPETIKHSLELADIVKLNRKELKMINDLFSIDGPTPIESAKQLMEKLSFEICLITLGAEGVIAIHRDGEVVEQPGCEVTVVDTVGSGDASSAGFVAGILNKLPLQECCALGNSLGALVAGKSGGMCTLTEEELAPLKEKLA